MLGNNAHVMDLRYTWGLPFSSMQFLPSKRRIYSNWLKDCFLSYCTLPGDKENSLCQSHLYLNNGSRGQNLSLDWTFFHLPPKNWDLWRRFRRFCTVCSSPHFLADACQPLCVQVSEVMPTSPRKTFAQYSISLFFIHRKKLGGTRRPIQNRLCVIFTESTCIGGIL